MKGVYWSGQNLGSIGTCQIKVSAHQYHVTILQAQVKSSQIESRTRVLKLTADELRNWFPLDCRFKTGYFI